MLILVSNSSVRTCRKFSVHRPNFCFLNFKIPKALRKVRKYWFFIINLNSKKVKLRYFEHVFAHYTEAF